MHEFRPDLNTILTVGPHRYSFPPHHHFPREVHRIPREETTTYQLKRLEDNSLWALKVMNEGNLDRHRMRAISSLASYDNLVGLTVTVRIYLMKYLYPTVIACYPTLENAILMPWIAGTSWTGFMDNPQASATYHRRQAIQLALATSKVLWGLEEYHLAHTDIAGENLILPHFNGIENVNYTRVELIDIEGMYIPGIPPPQRPSRGWQGYQHRNLDKRGNYRPEGDRFAGAMLLTEMLTWWNSLVRATTPYEYDALFQNHHGEPVEHRKRRLKAVRNTLWKISPRLCSLFDQAWLSSDLAECPDFGTWMMYLLEAWRKWADSK